jgi:hypothetical protein
VVAFDPPATFRASRHGPVLCLYGAYLHNHTTPEGKALKEYYYDLELQGVGGGGAEGVAGGGAAFTVYILSSSEMMFGL